jgi:hypothetical protein
MEQYQEDVHSPLTVFYSYAHKDEKLRDELEKHLSTLHREGLISSWSDRKIVPGTEWAQEIDTHLNSASIILLLISPAFLASAYCYSVEMKRALERHDSGEAFVIPIILRPVYWQATPFAFLQALPRDMKPVTTWSNQNEAFEDIAQGLSWTIEHLRSTPAVPPAKRVKAPVPPLSVLDRQNRQRILTRLYASYREVQEQSLQGTALITLLLQSDPKAIDQSAEHVSRHLDKANRVLPPETPIQQIFDEAGGKPGAGKSTLLLHLGQSLLMRAERDEQELLPVILNLSSWMQKRQPLREWLVEVLFASYRVPRKLGKRWVQSGQFLLLLDGLDEVAEPARGACIDAINAYSRDHLLPLVVCSRTSAYHAQRRRLLLQSAVVVQPLTPEQIEDYLKEAGTELAVVHTALQQDAVLRELATSPLMLHVMTIAYRGTTGEILQERGSLEALKRQIFATYTARMLQSDEARRRFHPQYMLMGLIWLARQMRQQRPDMFYVELLQSSWLSGPLTQRIYTWFGVRFPGILMGVLLTLVILPFFTFITFPVISAAILLGGWLGWLLSRGNATQRPAVSEGKTRGSIWFRLLRWLVVSMLIG